MGQKIKPYLDSFTTKRVLDVLERTTFPKKTNSGQAMTKCGQGYDPYLKAIYDDLAAGRPITKEQFRYLVWAVDLAAVTIQDNLLKRWDGEVLNLASKLRQSYAKIYGENAYV